MSSEVGPKKRKRTHLSWKDLPAFCDAAASVSAASFGARRLPEIKALWRTSFRRDENHPTSIESLLSGGGKTSSRHLRRRATSHLSRKRHRYPTQNHKEASATVTKKSPSRKAIRNKKALLQSSHEGWRAQSTVNVPADSGRTNWMTTHLWHAKRFHMEDLWGWKVPVIHSNRGGKAALRLAREGKTLIHDATWRMQPIWLAVSSTAVPYFQESLRRIIPNFQFSASIAGALTGQGMIHNVDSFPRGALGPVDWIVSQNPLLGKESKDKTLFVYLFLHPSLQTVSFKCINDAINQKRLGIEGPYRSIDGGVSCLQLRGQSVMECLRAGLQTCNDSQQSELKTLFNDNEVRWYKRLPHGSTLLLPFDAARSDILVRSQCPRDPVLNCNNGVCGVDVICSPDVVKKLFHALVLEGEACAIGVAEQSHLCLECHPTLPFFPRDFPDTSDGISYWKGDTEKWNIVRAYYEGGLGRVRLEKGTSDAVDWSQLVCEAASASDSSTVVVRGVYGKPFVDALMSCGKLPELSDEPPIRRKRRRVKNPSNFSRAQPTSKELVRKLKHHCSSLADSLTLPALLLCHVRIDGPGTMGSGASLFAINSYDNPLGFATSGSFSPVLGRSHGMGAVGAVRLLKAVAFAGDNRSAVVVKQLNGAREIQLRVRVRHKGVECDGSLSLLL